MRNLAAPATGNGQCCLSGQDGNLTFLSWALTDPTMGYTTGVFRVDPSKTGGATTLDITAVDQFGGPSGTFTQDLTIPPSGFFTVTAQGNELIKTISFTADGQLDDVQQVRVDGVMKAIPEPSTWAMMILGFFGIGFMAYRRKQNGSAFRVA